MIEERAIILDTGIAVSGGAQAFAKVRVQRTSACETCSLKSGCGQSALSKLSSERCLELDVDNSLGAQIGDEVMIAIPEQGLLNASLRVYLIPLVIMLVAALVADMLFSGQEIWVMLAALVGLLSGFLWARVFSQKNAFNAHFLPKMTRILSSKNYLSSKR